MQPVGAARTNYERLILMGITDVVTGIVMAVAVAGLGAALGFGLTLLVEAVTR